MENIFKIIDDIKNFIIGFVAGIKEFVAGFKTNVEFEIPEEETTL